jgi:hypothetical protein
VKRLGEFLPTGRIFYFRELFKLQKYLKIFKYLVEVLEFSGGKIQYLKSCQVNFHPRQWRFIKLTLGLTKGKFLLKILAIMTQNATFMTNMDHNIGFAENTPFFHR